MAAPPALFKEILLATELGSTAAEKEMLINGLKFTWKKIWLLSAERPFIFKDDIKKEPEAGGEGGATVSGFFEQPAKKTSTHAIKQFFIGNKLSNKKKLVNNFMSQQRCHN